MGDSGLTVYLGIAAWAIVLLALVITAVAWRIPKRPVRVGLGLGLMVLGLLGGGLSFVAWLLVTGLGAAVLILGIRTRRPGAQDRGIEALGQSWAWVFGLGLTFVVIAVTGRWCHAVFERLRSRGAVWSWMWFAFTLMLFPVGWFGRAWR